MLQGRANTSTFRARFHIGAITSARGPRHAEEGVELDGVQTHLLQPTIQGVVSFAGHYAGVGS